MSRQSTSFFIGACATIIGHKFEWFSDTAAILVMLAIGFITLMHLLEKKLK